MRLFKPLLDTNYLKSYMAERIRNLNLPRSRRYAKKYQLSEGIPPKINNLLGFAKNKFCSLAKDYKHGKYQLIWLKKHYYDDGPRIQHREPEDPDSYRKVIILNNVDLFIHTIVAHQMRDCLLKTGQLEPLRSPEKNILVVNAFILKAMENNRPYYYQTDIIHFGESFDIDIAKETLLRRLKCFMDQEDIDLFRNIYDSFKEKTEGLRASGSPLDQLLSEMMLSRLNDRLQNDYKELINHSFIRFGEDMVFAFLTEEDCFAMDTQLQKIVKDELGQNCHIHEMLMAEVYPKEYAKWKVPVIDEKGLIGRFDRHGLDFCGYHYSITDTKHVLVQVRNRTMGKIADRIREYTDGGSIRYSKLPNQRKDRKLEMMIKSLNEFFGFYYGKGSWCFSKQLGVGSLFCLPKKMDSCFIENQARRLNHYMLRRIRHLHLRNLPGNEYRNQREQVDKAYREMGLRTIIDARNKILV